MVFFNSQLSLMLEIGIPVTNALRAIADQTKNRAFQEIILTMLKDLEEGKQLSEAMNRYPEIFTSVFISMVKAGETGGALEWHSTSLGLRPACMPAVRLRLLTQA